MQNGDIIITNNVLEGTVKDWQRTKIIVFVLHITVVIVNRNYEEYQNVNIILMSRLLL